MGYVTRKTRQIIESAFGIEIKRAQTRNAELWDSLLMTREIVGLATDEEASFLKFCRDHIGSSKAQLLQDLFAIFQLANKKGGFFVEFGATDGVSLSNTFLLESAYEWTGIVAEPAHAWHATLSKNRRCAIDFRCVAATSGSRVVFNETEWLELSTMDKFSSRDKHAATRVTGKRYEVKTVSLNDLLREHQAPKKIDYLSVDTEGSELSILEALDFGAYTPQIITVEHNFVDESRRGIYVLLSDRGYIRKFHEFSKFDDWYVLQR
jgi:FkbM family methyltransferase